LTNKQYLVRVCWPTVKIIGNVSLVQGLKRLVYHGRFYAIEPTACVGGRRERREGEEGRGGREVEEMRWKVEQKRLKGFKGFPPSVVHADACMLLVHVQEYLLLLVSLGAVKADPDSCSQ